ncbi:esterase/lipase family protein [Paratissierella segnis]|jgi:hypothetical protein|uniref:Alpha/beta fold hydrolase n=1 Tax=Paratissierella segnis TaxID=2763679 RepID=A0A926EV54_9FIRM|nr:alpha/beta fold hydrolase [Paratissierella segnis]MBC8586884.1 alpha/beta fold hydrolase [Paratissierella segnis]
MNYPIVFIPGLFGSLGDDVIKGTGEFSFGLAEKIYKPFIEILNSMGYIEGLNLFVSYYDWKMSVLDAVNKYLYQDIEIIKYKTGMNKVILIGHSLGGLLGRAYINYFSPDSVDKLIMIGTPNLGAVNAYYFWSGGKLPYQKVEDNPLYNALKIGFIMYLNIFQKENYIETLREAFPVAKDLLPSYKYESYLFYNKDGTKRGIPIEEMTINNSFLNRLEDETNNAYNKYFIVSGTGIKTNKKFLVDINDSGKTKWTDGKPIKTYVTNRGDGTVITDSTLGCLNADSIVIEGNHTDILYKSADYLSAILEKPIVKETKISKAEKAYNIFTDNIAKAGIDIKSKNVQVVKISSDKYWVMVTE